MKQSSYKTVVSVTDRDKPATNGYATRTMDGAPKRPALEQKFVPATEAVEITPPAIDGAVKSTQKTSGKKDFSAPSSLNH